MTAARVVVVAILMLAASGCLRLTLITLRPECQALADELNACAGRTGCDHEQTCMDGCAQEVEAMQACERKVAQGQQEPTCASDRDCSDSEICTGGRCRPKP
ncbi:MAG: hypothetical protein JRI68_06605 [Deltaproteobacteria bacterium]|nr:hypothetical protein [Deltaproteobacteria bacterium]